MSKPQPTVKPLSAGYRKKVAKLLSRTIVVASLLASGIVGQRVLAQTVAPGTVIENQATGSFTDSSDGSVQLVESNVVTVTVAEVAGITVTASGSSDDGEVNPGDVISFDFTITNVGNDPTQFFIPGVPSAVSNGSAGTLQIVAYDPDGDGTEAASQAVSIDVPPAGIRTGDSALGLPNGSIPPGGTVTVRVPVTVDSGALDGSVVSVTLGETTPDGTTGSTQNQPYVADTSDVYTQDNQDTDAVDSSLTAATETEAVGVLASGEEREASASQDSGAIVVATSNPSTPPICDFETTVLDWRNTSPAINSVSPSSFPPQTFSSTGNTYTISYSGGPTGGFPNVSRYIEAPDYQVIFLAYTTSSIQDADDSFSVTIDFDSGSVDTLKFSIDDIDNGQISGGAEAFTVVGYNGASTVTPIVVPQNNTYLRQASRPDGSVFVDTTSPIDLNYNPSTQSDVDLGTADIYFDQPVDRVVVTAQVSPDATAVPNAGGGIDIRNLLTCGKDYGDAPDTYGTDATDSGGEGVGPSHAIVNGLQLGTAPDSEPDAATPLDGSGDGVEDDGVSLATLTDTDSTYAIPAAEITVTNTTGRTATLHAWLDFDGSGTFEPDEYTSQTIPDGVNDGNPSGALTWSGAGVSDLTGNTTTYARFRLTTDNSISGTTSGGAAIDGEVEDYAVAISSSAGSASPFICDSSLYIVIGDRNVPFSQLNRINRTTDPFSFDSIGPPTSDYNYNALAYNPTDNYLYAIVNTVNASSPFASGEIIRIGSDGVPVSLGQPVGDAVSPSPNSATFLADGTYVVAKQSEPIYTIDLTTTPPVATSKGSVSGTKFEDIAVNPYDTTPNRIYAIDDNTDRLVYFDLNNTGAGATPAIAGGNATTNHNHGSQFYDLFGNLLYRSATNNALYTVNPDGTDTLIANTPSGGSHDGASCFAVGLEKDIDTTAPTPAGQNVTYTYRIGNSSDIAMTVTLTDDLRAVADYPSSADDESSTPVSGTYTGGVSTPSGTVSLSNSDQTIAIADIVLAPQSFTTITAEVTIPASASPDTYYNQATLSGLPPGFVGVVESDYLPTSLYGDPTPVEVIAPVASDPNVLLVKRITAINNSATNPNDGTLLDEFVDDTASAQADDDNHPNWPSNYLLGALNGGVAKPVSDSLADTVEYSIYFLSTGDVAARNVLMCDRIPQFTSLLPNAYANLPRTEATTAPNSLGIALDFNGSELALTGAADDDAGYYFPPTVEPSTQFPNIDCGGPNDNGAVVVNLGDLPIATGAGAPLNSFGAMRFQVNID